MATYSITPAAQPYGIHKTLTTTTADVINIAQSGSAYGVEVFNRAASGGEALYVRADGTTAVGAADGTIYIPPGGSFFWKHGRGATTLSIVGNGNAYSVHVIDHLD